MLLLSGQETNGNGAVANIQNTIGYKTGRPFTVYAWGTFGGGTVTLQGSNDLNEWFNLASFTAKEARLSEFRFAYVRGNLSGGTGANVNLAIS